MRAVDIIRKKRDREALSAAEIHHFVSNYTKELIPDYQASALLMAFFLNGATVDETVALTNAMMQSGATMDWSDLPGPKVDKHSTGGVGDKTSFILAPLAAAAGIYVPMISGRGLGHTGGTLDKLESIPGFNVNLSLPQFRTMLKEARCGLIGQTKDIAPADKKLYALRDVTATVESYPLISASIMSKKLAEGIDALVLDVKTGVGAFMKTLEDSKRLARTMIDIGKGMGKSVVGLITDMNQPLGNWVGNSLEIFESLETLKGRGPKDLTEVSVELAAHMLVLGKISRTLDEARQKVHELIKSGAGLEAFRKVIQMQGGNPKVVEDYKLLPAASKQFRFHSISSGFVAGIHAEKIGIAAMLMGAGRERVDSVIDHSVGLQLHKKIGDAVNAGEALCTMYYNDEGRLASALELLNSAYLISAAPVKAPPLIYEVLD
ncbi:MAG: thymidine phosphorylase [Acidobacteriia bacterium]|nr:thymidine phosphorylase [Terriglobia bacterium]